MRTVPGADQPTPLLFRQDKYPFPYLPPTRNAAVFRLGTITMQWAFAIRSCGIPLSGAAMTSENTAAASFSRFTESLPLASRGAIARVAARIIRMPTSSVGPVNPAGTVDDTVPTARVAPTWPFCRADAPGDALWP